jgi:hypothetical protein
MEGSGIQQSSRETFSNSVPGLPLKSFNQKKLSLTTEKAFDG